MRKARIVKPALFTDAKTGRWPPEWWVLYIGCTQACDKYGRMPGSPEVLAAAYPFWDCFDHAAEFILMLVDTGKAIEYEVDGEPYLWLRAFPIHQRLDKRERNPQPEPEWWSWDEDRPARQNVSLNLERLDQFRRNPDVTPHLSPPKGGGDRDRDRDRDRDPDQRGTGGEQSPGGGRPKRDPDPTEASTIIDAQVERLKEDRDYQPRWLTPPPAWEHVASEALAELSAEDVGRILEWAALCEDSPYYAHAILGNPVAPLENKHALKWDGYLAAWRKWQGKVTPKEIVYSTTTDGGFDQV